MQSKFTNAAAEAVSEEHRPGGWKVYPHYGVAHSSGEAYAIARRVPLRERCDRVRLYAPLIDTLDLFLEFARLADRKITEEVWLHWLHSYGVLGLDRLGKPYRAWTQGGPDEKFSRFVEEARAANRLLKLYEAATARYGPKVEIIAEHMPEIYQPYSLETPDRAKEWALEEVDVSIQRKLTTECFPQLYRNIDHTCSISWDFGSLLGAVYLQMAFLRTAKGRERRCKAPGCTRVISFNQPKLPRDPAVMNDRKTGYRTRRDKVFCSEACKVRWHYWNRKRSKV